VSGPVDTTPAPTCAPGSPGQRGVGRVVRGALILAGGLLLFAYLGTVTDELGSLGGDNARYLLLADALRGGHGYVEVERPAKPPHTLYPPMFPLLLAPLRAVDPGGYRLPHLLLVASAVAAVAALFFLLRASFGAGWALAGTALFGFLPVLARSLLPILSELPFLALTLWALVAWELHARRGGALGLPIVFAGLLAAAAFLTRTAGIVLMIALVAAALLRWPLQVRGPAGFRRQGLALLALLAILLPVVAGWHLWTHQEGAHHFGYLKQLVSRDPYQPALGQVDAAALWARVSTRAAAYARQIPDLFAEGYGLGPAAAGVAQLVLGALLLFGLAACLLRPRLWLLHLALYLPMVVMWPWYGERFLLPALPLLAALLVGGAVLAHRLLGRVLPRPAAVAAAGLPVFLVLVGSVVGWIRFHRVAAQPLRYLAPAPLQTSVDFSAFYEAHIWQVRGPRTAHIASRAWGEYLAIGHLLAREHPEAVVACRKPRLTALTAGVRAEGLPGPTDPDRWLAMLHDKGVGYLISLKGAFQADPAQRALDAARQRHPEAMQPVLALDHVELLRLSDSPVTVD
jgi:hypothetical protein